MSKKIHVIVDSFFSNGEIENKITGQTTDPVKARQIALTRAETSARFKSAIEGENPDITHDDDNTGITRVVGNPSEFDSVAFSTFHKIDYFNNNTDDNTQ